MVCPQRFAQIYRVLNFIRNTLIVLIFSFIILAGAGLNAEAFQLYPHLFRPENISKSINNLCAIPLRI